MPTRTTTTHTRRHGLCLGRQTLSYAGFVRCFLKAGVVQIVGTVDYPAWVNVFGICAPCAELHGEGLAHALLIFWENWCRKEKPPYGVYLPSNQYQ